MATRRRVFKTILSFYHIIFTVNVTIMVYKYISKSGLVVVGIKNHYLLLIFTA